MDLGHCPGHQTSSGQGGVQRSLCVGTNHILRYPLPHQRPLLIWVPVTVPAYTQSPPPTYTPCLLFLPFFSLHRDFCANHRKLISSKDMTQWVGRKLAVQTNRPEFRSPASTFKKKREEETFQTQSCVPVTPEQGRESLGDETNGLMTETGLLGLTGYPPS